MKSNLVAEIIGSKVRESDKKDIIFTPENISVEMIEMMDESAFTPDATFIDLYCKSGNILKAIYKRLMASKYMKEGELADERKRREYILKHQLFGVCADKFCWMISIRNVYGQLVENSNIKYIKGFDSMVNNDDQALLWKTLREEFNMKFQFDHVVMNPPYNKGMDLDFVDFGYKVAKKDVVAITPAKWQTAADNHRVSSKNCNYKQFRQKYVPHMVYVCFYPDCRDIFDITEHDGITYYLIDKEEHNSCIVENKCKRVRAFNNSLVRDLRNQSSLCNTAYEIEKYLGLTGDNGLNIENFNTDGKYKLWVGKYAEYGEVVPSGSGSGTVKRNFFKDGTTPATQLSCIVDDETIPYTTYVNVFASNDKQVVESVKSYLDSKLVRCLIFFQVSSYNNILNNNTFRYVPNVFEQITHYHIFTDQELYEYFGLNKEDAKTTDGVRYRDIIDAVIKERK